MNFKKLSLVLAILLISVVAIGSVSASEDIVLSGDGNADLISKNITVNNENLDTYFNDDGLTDEVSEGDTLNLEGDFSDFSFNVNKNNIVINGLEGNKLTNCVVIGDSIEGLTISGLNFENYNLRNAISLTSPCDCKILNNNIIANYDEDYVGDAYSFEAIIIWAGGENIVISGNTIDMLSTQSSMYVYAIDLVDCSADYMTGGNHISYLISDNTISVNTESTCPYGMYLAGIKGDSENPFIIKNNTLNILTNSSYSDCYGFAISESWMSGVEQVEFVIIENNDLFVVGNNMVYGIECYGANDLDFNNNYIDVISNAGAYGIGCAKINNLDVLGNTVNVIGGDYSSVYTYDAVGAGLAPIYAGSSSNVNSKNNTFIVNEENFDLYFNDGKLTDIVNDGDVLIFNMSLKNQDLTIDKSITLDGNGVGAIIDGTIYVDGEDIVIFNLLIDNINKNGIFVKEGSSNIAILANDIVIVGLNAGPWDSFMAICTAGGVSDVVIKDNSIFILGNAPYNYAIDISDCDPVTYMSASYNPTGISIISNNINMNLVNMGEAIYTSIACDVIIDSNVINIVTTGDKDVYAIAASTAWAPGLVNSYNVTVSNNDIHVTGNNMVYGVELFGSDLDIFDNDIVIKSNGGAYAVALKYSDNVNIKDNSLSVDATTPDVVTSDMIGSGIGGVKCVESTNVNVKSNYIVAGNNKGNLAVDAEGATVSDNTPKTGSTIIASDLTKYYGDSKKLTITLKDENGNVLANKKVTITISGKTYSATTNANGQASFAIGNSKGTYNVAIKFAGDNTYSTVSKTVKVKVVAPVIKAVSTKVKKGKYLQISFKTSDNKVIKNTKVTIKINGKTYTVTTNSKGVAYLKLNLKKKTYTVKAAFKSTSVYGKTTKSFKVKII